MRDMNTAERHDMIQRLNKPERKEVKNSKLLDVMTSLLIGACLGMILLTALRACEKPLPTKCPECQPAFSKVTLAGFYE